MLLFVFTLLLSTNPAISLAEIPEPTDPLVAISQFDKGLNAPLLAISDARIEPLVQSLRLRPLLERLPVAGRLAKTFSLVEPSELSTLKYRTREEVGFLLDQMMRELEATVAPNQHSDLRFIQDKVTDVLQNLDTPLTRALAYGQMTRFPSKGWNLLSQRPEYAVEEFSKWLNDLKMRVDTTEGYVRDPDDLRAGYTRKTEAIVSGARDRGITLYAYSRSDAELPYLQRSVIASGPTPLYLLGVEPTATKVKSLLVAFLTSTQERVDGYAELELTRQTNLERKNLTEQMRAMHLAASIKLDGGKIDEGKIENEVTDQLVERYLRTPRILSHEVVTTTVDQLIAGPGPNQTPPGNFDVRVYYRHVAEVLLTLSSIDTNPHYQLYLADQIAEFLEATRHYPELNGDRELRWLKLALKKLPNIEKSRSKTAAEKNCARYLKPRS